MKQQKFGKTGMQVPRIVVGCMRMNSLEQKDAQQFVYSAIEQGATFFDHADIYGAGNCETMFGKILERDSSLREKILVQSKCGIVPGVMFDFSKKHIIESVDNILKRLHTDYLDSLLLHRPDALVEPEEVAEAWDTLYKEGKVRQFGVSNHSPMQIELLSRYVEQPIVANQLQLSITNANMISSGMQVNMLCEGGINRDGSVLDYCRLHDITIQAWSPFQYGFFEGVFLGNKKFPELNKVIDKLAKQYEVSNTTIATAWILRHPANIQVVSGTMKETRLQQIIQATQIKLTRQEWYEIYLAAGYLLP